jgi:hypothetical protein
MPAKVDGVPLALRSMDVLRGPITGVWLYPRKRAASNAMSSHDSYTHAVEPIRHAIEGDEKWDRNMDRNMRNGHRPSNPDEPVTAQRVERTEQPTRRCSQSAAGPEAPMGQRVFASSWGRGKAEVNPKGIFHAASYPLSCRQRRRNRRTRRDPFRAQQSMWPAARTLRQPLAEARIERTKSWLTVRTLHDS